MCISLKTENGFALCTVFSLSDIHNPSSSDKFEDSGQALLHSRVVSDSQLAFCLFSAGLSKSKKSLYVYLADMIPFMQC